MEGPEKKKPEDMSPDERNMLVQMQMHAETIRDYVYSKPVSIYWVIELDDLLNESYEEFIPESNSEGLKPYCYDFIETVKAAEQKLSVVISESVKRSFNRSFTKPQLQVWRELIKRIKGKMIPRQKKLGLDLSIKVLESAVLQLEIKIANDDE